MKALPKRLSLPAQLLAVRRLRRLWMGSLVVVALVGAPSAEANTGWEPIPLNVSGATNERGSQQKYENRARIAVNSAGDAVAVWQTELESGVYARRFDAAAGRWDDAVAELAPPEQDDSDVRVALDELGNAMVMWKSDGGDGRLRATRYSAGDGRWDALPTVVSDRAGSFARLEMDGAGDATAVWQRAGKILARRYNGRSRQWDARPIVLSKHGGKAALPELAINRDGDAVAPSTRAPKRSGTCLPAPRPVAEAPRGLAVAAGRGDPPHELRTHVRQSGLDKAPRPKWRSAAATK
jgi:hypothetical protein